ncbi:hypothetical protein RRG08_048772 [Elysia crispata]|uniref:Uncharacterized protein n=1 Tax=Elysia crispata TaxID=231223 RepID=A0AAE1ANY4_9GAST|nr:hypothetical protein RRG08_048772 [Elysia crispata]
MIRFFSRANELYSLVCGRSIPRINAFSYHRSDGAGPQKVLNARILYQTKISERRKMTPVAHCNLAARGSLCLKKDLRGASHHVPSGPMPQGRCCDAKNRVPLRSGSS